MKHYYFFLSFALFLNACTSDEQLDSVFENNPAINLSGVVMNIPDFVFEEEETRTDLVPTASSVEFSWKEGDQVGIYTESTSMANFDIDQISQDAKSATFDGGGFSLTEGSTYYAFYPYNAASTIKTSVAVDYTGQTQTINNDCSRLANYDYMTAKAIASSTNEASFDFNHLGAIVRFKIPVHVAGRYTKLTFHSKAVPFPITGTVDVSADHPTITPTTNSTEITLDLGTDGISFTDDDGILTAYMVVPPVDLSNKTIQVSLTEYSGSTYVYSAEGKNLTAGRAFAFNSFEYEDDSVPYLTFKADGDQTLGFNDGYNKVQFMEYSINGSEWKPAYSGIPFGGTNVLRLRGKCGDLSNDSYYTSFKFSTAAPVYCSGDIRVLLDYSNYDNITSSGQMQKLFYNCSRLVTAPSLPATTLADRCYASMFYGCSRLVTAPSLPATTLAESCYSNMFYSCSSLTAAPSLPATTLAESCYSSMFRNCSSLTAAPSLPATTLAGSCYYNMFYNCSRLVTAPSLPATTLAGSCYSNMFYGCSSLTTAPSLPATTLAVLCYSNMFHGCSSLTAAPSLPATTLADKCYAGMFDGCSSLTAAPSLPATTLAEWCYRSMFSGCSSLTTAPSLPATTLTELCYFGMFSGCSSLTSAPSLPATTLVKSCYRDMFSGCSSLNYVKMMGLQIWIDNINACAGWLDGVSNTGTLVKNKNAIWYDRDSGVPTGWTIEYATE